MVSAAPTAGWTEKQTVSMAIRRIWGGRTVALEMNSQEPSWEISSSREVRRDAPPGDRFLSHFSPLGKPSFLTVGPPSLCTLQSWRMPTPSQGAGQESVAEMGNPRPGRAARPAPLPTLLLLVVCRLSDRTLAPSSLLSCELIQMKTVPWPEILVRYHSTFHNETNRSLLAHYSHWETSLSCMCVFLSCFSHHESQLLHRSSSLASRQGTRVLRNSSSLSQPAPAHWGSGWAGLGDMAFATSASQAGTTWRPPSGTQ